MRLTLGMLAATGMLAGVEACVSVQNIRASKSRSVDAVMLTKSALASTAYTKCNSNRVLLASTWGIEPEASALPVQTEEQKPWKLRYPLWKRCSTPASGCWLLWSKPEHSSRKEQLSLAEHAALPNGERLWVYKGPVPREH